MKFQRVLSIMLSLTLSFSGAIWAAPSVQAFAAEDQTMAEETDVTAESTPADEVEEQESAQPAEETTADPADTNDAVEAADPADEGGAVETPAADDVDNATENAEESDETTVVETTDSADNDGISSAAESSVENTATKQKKMQMRAPFQKIYLLMKAQQHRVQKPAPQKKLLLPRPIQVPRQLKS